MGLPMHSHFRVLAVLATSTLMFVSSYAIADVDSEGDLLTLAWNHFKYEIANFENTSGEERKAFEEFFKNVQEDKSPDLEPEVQFFGAVRQGDHWGIDRTIRARWIVWLCKDPIASKKIPPGGIVITGAKIDGKVDLSWTKMQFPLRANMCYFTDRLILTGASVRGLYLQNSYFKAPDKRSWLTKAVDGDGLTVEGDVNFSDLSTETPVSLRNATVGGHFMSHGAEYFADSVVAALDLSSAKIGSAVDLSYADVKGEVRFDDAEVTGDLDCASANMDGLFPLPAFSGTSMKVAGDVVFSANPNRSVLPIIREFTANGPIVIRGATIGGSLNCRLAKVGAKVKAGNTIKKDGSTLVAQINSESIGIELRISEIKALDVTSAKIDGDVLVGIDVSKDVTDFDGDKTLSFFGARIGGKFGLSDEESLGDAILDLRDAKARILSNTEGNWPKSRNLRLQGFVFDELGGQASLEAKTQIKWLRRQSPFVVQPYEQMATVFRNMGYQEESVKVGIAESWDLGVRAIKKDFDSIASVPAAISRDAAKWRYEKAFAHGWGLIQAVVQFLFYDLLWYFVFGPLIQYGYQPWNALVISFIFVFIGTRFFRFAAESEILVKKDSDPELSRLDRTFSPFIYSLETFVPLVKLGVAEYWHINANVAKPIRLGKFTLLFPGVLVLWYYWTHIIAGWVFTSLWVAAFTGILKH
jgi:hypothetical protein